MITCQEVRYTEVGRGEQPVVLLHGLFGTPENWRGVMEALADDYRLLAPQFPIDHSPDRHGPQFQSIAQLTEYVGDFFDLVGLDQAVLCGNSLGGQVAIDFCLDHPGRIEKLVLTGSAGLFENNLGSGRTLRATREMVRQQAGEIFYDPRHVTDELVEEVYQVLCDRRYARFLIRVAKATRNRDMRQDLVKLDVPTLIVWGRNDRVTPPFVAEQFSDGITGAELVFLDRCGHAPPIERPGAFSRALRAFLESPAPNGNGNGKPGEPQPWKGLPR
jgi:pimeloyl-ACP methyl ester carboxylesterase